MAAAAVCTPMPLRLPLLGPGVDFMCVDDDDFEPQPRAFSSALPAPRSTFSSFDRPTAFPLSSQRSSTRSEPKRRAVIPTRPRPTQRRPIDDNTAIPADLFERLEAAAREARNRSAVHRLAFSNTTGERYLLHTNAEELRAARQRAESTPETDMSVDSIDSLESMPSPERASTATLFRSCAMEVDLGAESNQHWQVACAA